MNPKHQYVVDTLAKYKGSWPAIAAGAGVSTRTVFNIAHQKVQPNFTTIEALRRQLMKMERA